MSGVRSLTADHQFDFSFNDLRSLHNIIFVVVLKEKEIFDSRENDTIFCSINIIPSFCLVLVFVHYIIHPKKGKREREHQNCAK